MSPGKSEYNEVVDILEKRALSDQYLLQVMREYITDDRSRAIEFLLFFKDSIHKEFVENSKKYVDPFDNDFFQQIRD